MNFVTVWSVLLGCVLAAPQVQAQTQLGGTDLPPTGLHLERGRQSDDPAWAKFASGGGNVGFLAAATILPLATDKKQGQQQTLRTADALITATALSFGLKMLVHEKRPNGSNDQSFPSGHTTAAFAVATMQAHYHPRQAWLWYGGAAVIGASRVTLHEHYWHDVIAGALLGYGTARLELSQRRGLALRPFIHEDKEGERIASFGFSRDF